MEQRGFNIITGVTKPSYPSNSNNRRFTSLESLRTCNQTDLQQIASIRALGISRDNKLFNYSYGKDYNPSLYRQMKTTLDRNQTEGSSLKNASKIDFNIISHVPQRRMQWSSVKKQCPVSKLVELGRICAPNYTLGYMDEPLKYRQSGELCGKICRMQKSYGTERFFRKFK